MSKYQLPVQTMRTIEHQCEYNLLLLTHVGDFLQSLRRSQLNNDTNTEENDQKTT